MIEQKATEMIFTIPPAKRSLRDLQRAIDQGVHATKYVAHVKVPKCKY
jgi:RNA polymerase-associated protein CTR9